MSNTDETARAILSSSPPTIKPSDGTRFGDALAKVLQNYHGDLQRLAKLWLLAPEIISDIESLDYDQEYEIAGNLISKIKALTEEDEDGK